MTSKKKPSSKKKKPSKKKRNIICLRHVCGNRSTLKALEAYMDNWKTSQLQNPKGKLVAIFIRKNEDIALRISEGIHASHVLFRIPLFSFICQKSEWTILVKNLESHLESRGTESSLSFLSSIKAIWPKTYVLPDEVVPKSAFKNGYHIFKPSNAAQGDGIYLIKSNADLKRRLRHCIDNPRSGVLQQYIEDPLLIDGFKFDLRIYLVYFLHVDPKTGKKTHKSFIFNDGLVRICTHKYEKPKTKNAHKLNSHLTNYSLNKYDKNYEHTEDVTKGDVGSKRTLKSTLNYLERIYDERKYDFESNLESNSGIKSNSTSSNCGIKSNSTSSNSGIRSNSTSSNCGIKSKIWSSIQSTCRFVSAALTLGLEQEGINYDLFPSSSSSSPSPSDGCAISVSSVPKSLNILGIDILLRKDFSPVLLEINAAPSIRTDSVYPMTGDFERAKPLDQYHNWSNIAEEKCNASNINVTKIAEEKCNARNTKIAEEKCNMSNSNVSNVEPDPLASSISPQVIFEALSHTPKKGKKCVCRDHHRPHEHRPCLVDLHVKLNLLRATLKALEVKGSFTSDDPSTIKKMAGSSFLPVS